MRAFGILSVLISLSVLFTSCDWDNSHTVVGKGDVESMEVSLPGFSGVSVTGTCDVEIRIGEPQSVELGAQSQILDVMTYEVKSDILHIGFKPGYTVNTTEEIYARIVVPDFDFAGITGAADFYISGTFQPLLDIYISGTGDVDAFDLEVDDCNITIEGAGNCEVNVNDNLDVQISGVGNVFYRGSPVVTTDISGVGNVTGIGN